MNNFRERLTHSISNLASPATEQCKTLDSLAPRGVVLGVDELALEFDELMHLLDQNIVKYNIDAVSANALRELDSQLEAMSGASNAGLWTRRALEEKVEWERVRMQARECLRLLSVGGAGTDKGPSRT